MRDSQDTNPDIIRTRYQSKSNQATINIELGLVTKQNISTSGNSTSSVNSAAGAGVIGDIAGGDFDACFTGETLISCATQVGENMYQLFDRSFVEVTANKGKWMVKAFNPDSTEIGYCNITDAFSHKTQKLLRVEIFHSRDGINNTLLHITPEHLVYNGKDFIPAGDLTANGALYFYVEQIEQLAPYQIKSIHKLTLDKPIDVYNITTEWGTYFANGAAVSNRKRDPDDTSIE